MEEERNHILGDFQYGFCNLEGEPADLGGLELPAAWDPEAAGLLAEIYPVIGKANLDLEGGRKDRIIVDESSLPDGGRPGDGLGREKWGRFRWDPQENEPLLEGRPAEVLAALSDGNDMAVELRGLLYSEIELSDYGIFEDEYDEGVSGALFELGLRLTEFFEDSFEENGGSVYNAFYRFRSAAASPRAGALAAFIRERLGRIMGPSAPDRLERAIECLEAVRNSGLAADAGRLWNVFLVKLYSAALFGDGTGGFQETDIRGGEYGRALRNSYEKIDGRLREIQQGNIRNMLELYSMVRLSPDAFRGHNAVRQLYNALNSSADLRGRYLSNPGSGGGNPRDRSGRKPSPKCFGVMYNKNTGEKYAAISGVFDPDKYMPAAPTAGDIAKATERKKTYHGLVALLQRIVGSAYTVIRSDDEVKYYHRKGKKMRSITARRYINYPGLADKIPGNRMFSCCERKLGTEFQRGCEHVFYIKYEPCVLCRRMIKEENLNRMHIITDVFCGGGSRDIPPDNLKKYDASAAAVK